MTLRFGPFLLNSDRRDLLRGAERVPITPKVFDLLVTLIEHRERVVEKRELLERLWPDGMIEEATLVQTVSMLRKAIGCSRGDGVRYIATIPGRGYRFVGDVQTGHSPAPPPATTAPPPPRVHILRWLAPALLLAVLLLGGWYLRRPVPSYDRPQPLTSYPGREIFPTFSPDGRRLAFQWDGNAQNWDIYVKVAGQDSPHRLTRHPAQDWSPAWSPDGRHIAFVRRDPDAGVNELLVIPPTGGPERSLLRGPLLGRLSAWNQMARLVAWHPDSRHVIVSHAAQDGQPAALWSISLATGELRQLTYPPPNTDGDMDPAISPDGRRLAFRRKLRGWTSDVFLVNLTPSLLPEGEPALIGPRMFAPAWAHDGSELFLVESPMRPSLWRVPSHAKSPPIRVREPFEAAFPAISSTGNHHAYSVIQIKTDIWQAQLTPQPNTPKPLIASTYLDIVPDFSPDGKRIAFTSARSGNTEIWTANSDGSQAVQLTHHNLSEADCPSFSPDGTRILYHANLDNFRDVMLIDDAGGQPLRLTYKEGRDVAPSWSRDGHWIYYASARSGGSTLWKLPVSGGPPQPVTTGSRAEESTDGKTLFVDDAGALWSMPVAGGPRTRLLTRNWANANFRVRHNGIYILADRALQFYDFQSKQTKQVFPTPSLASWGLAVSPDGSRVLFTQSQPEEADILMVSGFR